jgi:hypothetical protein
MTIGVLAVLAALPATARAGVWVTLAAGVAGSSAPSVESEFWFDTPHGPPLVAVNQFNGGSILEASTGGGSVFFGGAGTPVLLNLSDGSAYIAGGTPPDSAKYPAPGGTTGTPASVAPAAGGTLPSDAALLGITQSDPTLGPQSLTATVTDSLGNQLGTGTIDLPSGDNWWVLGLTPGDNNPPTGPGPIDPAPTDPEPTNPGPTDPEPTNPGPTDPEPTNPGPTDPEPPLPPPANHGGGGAGGGGSVNTPEPSTAVLVGLGGAAVGLYRRLKRVAL